MGDITYKPSHRVALTVRNLCGVDSPFFCVILSVGVCLSSQFDQSASLQPSYGISSITLRSTEGHTLQEVGEGHTVYLFRYIAFHGSGNSSPSAFTSLYALPEYTSLIT